MYDPLGTNVCVFVCDYLFVRVLLRVCVLACTHNHNLHVGVSDTCMFTSVVVVRAFKCLHEPHDLLCYFIMGVNNAFSPSINT